MNATEPVPFPSTDWRTVSRAGGPASSRDGALAAWVERYLPAIRSYLVTRWKMSGERAEDVVQGFMLDKVLEQDLIAQAEPARGRFRAFLMRSIDRYVLSQARRDKAAKRSPGDVASLDDSQQLHPADRSGPDVFDTAWAAQVLQLALGRMRDECEVSGRGLVWAVFEARIVRPTLGEAPPVPYEELLRRFHFASPEQASNLLVTAKRMFARVLRQVVAEYAENEADVEEEIRQLRQILSQGG